MREQSLEHIERALRVLTTLTENRFPAPEDVAAWRRLAPEAADKTVDELACDVIQNALKHRAKVRDMARPT